MLSEDVESVVARAGLWAGSLGRRSAGVEHIAAIMVPVDGNADRWAVIEQLLNEPGIVSGDVPGHPFELLTSDARRILDELEAVDPLESQLDVLERGVCAWVDALVVLSAISRTGRELGGGATREQQSGDADQGSLVDDRQEEENRLREPSQPEAVERAREFERWLTEIVEGELAPDALVELGPGAPPATPGMIAAAAVELLLGDRSAWPWIADRSDRSERLVAQLTSLVERRGASYRRLRQFWEALSEQQIDRFRVRLEVHLDEVDLEADPNEVFQRLAEGVDRGPSVPGGWDCGRSDEQRVGVLLLLAERLVRGDDTGELMWACDQVRGRFGARVGPLAIDGEGSFLTSPTRAGMTVFIGPPGSGKTTCLESAMLTWPGPLVATTTKRGDWRPGFISALLDKGPVWLLDATGEMEPPHPEVQPVRWSPLQAIHDWDSARRVGYVIAYSGQRGGLSDADFWVHSAYQMISTYLFAAHHGQRTMGEVASWIDAAEEAEVMGCLGVAGNDAAALQFASMQRMDERTRNSVFVTARVATDPFRSSAVRAVTDRPTFVFDEQLIASNGTVLVYADGFRAANTAALYALFIDAAINARKSLADSGWLGPHLMFGLDEVANITPLPSLPQVLTEGPGRGITGIFCLQDLQQARARWGGDGDLFLTSSGHRVIFPGTTNSELHDFVLRHVRPTTHVPPLGFHERPSERAGAPKLPESGADVASPGEAGVVVIDPLAQVMVAEQVRSFSAAEYVEAQHHAAVVYDERNRVVVRGVEPVRTDEPVIVMPQHEPSELEGATRFRDEEPPIPLDSDDDPSLEDLSVGPSGHDHLSAIGGPIGGPTRPHRRRASRLWPPPPQPSPRLVSAESDRRDTFDVVLDCRGRRGVSTALLRTAIRAAGSGDYGMEAADFLIRQSRIEPVVLFRGEDLDDARRVLTRLAQVAPDLAYLIRTTPFD